MLRKIRITKWTGRTSGLYSMRQHRSDRNAHVRDQRVAELLADLEPTVADELHQQALQWHADDGTAVDVALAWLIRSHSPARVTASPGKGRQHLSLLQRYGDDRRLPVEVLGDPGQTYDRNPDVFGGVLDALHSAGDVVPYRDDMERMFGESFADVRVALDRREALSGFDAGAVTHGRAIAFASSRPSRQLVAHELAHVLQARRAGVVHGLRGISSASDTAEREADSIASRVSAGGIVGGALAVRAAPSAALHFGPPDADKKKKKDEPEDLSLGDKNFEIRGESVALKTAWLAKDDKLVPTASRMRAPTKIAEILKAFKTEGIFYWLRDDEIPRIADDLRIAGPLPEEKAFKVTLAPSVFELIGPPPDAAMEWRRWEKGLYAVISTKYLKKAPHRAWPGR